jgi:hypothetical protein
MDIERRIIKTKIEVRAEGEGDQPTIVGHGAVFNSLSDDLGGFREMIMPGAFSEAVESDDVRALFNHDPNLILGRNISGTLRLAEDGVGLNYEIDPPETQYAKDLMVSIQRGDVDQSSFGFRVIEESWRQPDDENPLPTRILHKVRLFDVSPVTFPAYPATNVSMRALDKAKQIASGGGATGGADGHDATGRLAVKRRMIELMEKQ